MSESLGLLFYTSPVDPDGANTRRATAYRFAGENIPLVFVKDGGTDDVSLSDVVQVLLADSEIDPVLVTVSATISSNLQTITASLLGSSTLALSGGKSLILWNNTAKMVLSEVVLTLHGNPLGSTNTLPTTFPLGLGVGGSGADLSAGLGVWMQTTAGAVVVSMPLGTGLSIAGGTLHATGGGGGGSDWADITSKPTTLAGYGITDAQPLDSDLTVLAGITLAPNTMPARSSSGAAAAKAITDAGLALVAGTNAAAMRTTLGLGTGDDVTFNSLAVQDHLNMSGNTLDMGTGPITNIGSLNGNTITGGTGTLTLGTHTLTASADATVGGTNTGDQTTVSGASGSTNALNSATTTVNVSSATAPTAGQILKATSGTAAIWVDNLVQIGFGTQNSSAVTTGAIPADARPDYAATIYGWEISVDSGTATVEFWKIASGTALPTVSNKINTSGVAISTGTSVRSTTVSDFTTTTITAGDIIICNIKAVSGVKWISVRLLAKKA